MTERKIALNVPRIILNYRTLPQEFMDDVPCLKCFDQEVKSDNVDFDGLRS